MNVMGSFISGNNSLISMSGHRRGVELTYPLYYKWHEILRYNFKSSLLKKNVIFILSAIGNILISIFICHNLEKQGLTEYSCSIVFVFFKIPQVKDCGGMLFTDIFSE